MNHPDRAQIRSVVADRHHRRRRAAAGQPCRAAAAGIPARPARARLWPDRNQRRRLPAISGPIMRPSRPRPAARTSPFVEIAILGEDDTPSAAGETRRDRHPHRGQHQMLLAQRPKRPRRCSPPTATSAPATSAISTRTAICSSSTARRTSSSAAARTSPRPRSRRPATPAPRSPKRACSARPTSGWAKCRSRSSIARRQPLDEDGAARFPRRQARQVQGAGALHLFRRAAAAPRHRQDRPARAESAVRAVEGRSPDIADRRRRRRRPDRRLRRCGRAISAATSPRGAASRRSAITSRSRATGGSRSPCRRSRPARESGPRCRRSSPTSLARRGRRSRSSRRR